MHPLVVVQVAPAAGAPGVKRGCSPRSAPDIDATASHHRQACGGVDFVVHVKLLAVCGPHADHRRGAERQTVHGPWLEGFSLAYTFCLARDEKALWPPQCSPPMAYITLGSQDVERKGVATCAERGRGPRSAAGPCARSRPEGRSPVVGGEHWGGSLWHRAGGGRF